MVTVSARSTALRKIEMKLQSRLILRLTLGFVMVAAMLFVPAGSFRFWQGWTFLALTYIPIAYLSLDLSKRDPKLMERRLQSREQLKEQRLLVRALKLAFFAAFLLPGLDYRFGWSRRLLGAVPLWLSMVSQALALSGLFLMFWVFRTNTFAARTIQVEAGQRVISTGPYGIVRHPMYLGSLIMWLSVPLALGSYVAWPAFALLVAFYVVRLLHEEKFLNRELPGYSDYCRRTPFRLVPFIW
jgi:protein-S-isoprenylcysteine O-methyltransferase Ste14